MRLFLTSLLLFLSTINQVFADEIIDGQFGPGALYRMAKPDNWNGTLMLYAHGYASPDVPVALPMEGDALISLLTSQGYAVAYTSYSKNGWVVKEGAQQTLQLLGLFTSKFGKANKVYISGISMGGLIAIKLLETYPDKFAGALTFCPVSGGSQKQFDYPAHVRALFDYFYPGVLPGNATYMDPSVDLNFGVVFPAIAAFQNDPSGVFAMASIAQSPLPYADPLELGESLVTALVTNADGNQRLQIDGIVLPTFDNQDVEYTGLVPPLLLADINANIDRFTASPAALSLLNKDYEPNGDLDVPHLTITTSRDPVVPGFNQTSYASVVAAAGNADNLVQRSVDRYGHCTFTPEEVAVAFIDFFVWAEYSVKPAP